jgi:3-methylcrotonyl-CoA carboxylase alpha subunit
MRTGPRWRSPPRRRARKSWSSQGIATPSCSSGRLVEQDGITRTVQLSRTGDVAWLSAPGADFPSLTTRWTRVEARRGSQHAAGAEVRSPMTGRVVVVHVREGDVVEKGQALVVVEAMKMEHGLKAPRAGVVAKVTCKPGDLVEGGVELVVLAEQEAS